MLELLLNNKTALFTHDQYTAKNDSETMVVFTCEGKRRRIRALLSGPISLSVNSEWEGYFGSVSNLVNMGDSVLQLFGRSIKQPWFGRKHWKNTSPLSFRFPLQFVSFKDAETEVFDPMLGLLSLLYPRVDSKKSNNASVLQLYFTPGPSVFYSTSNPNDTRGDRVTVRLGKFLHFEACYIKSVSMNVENSFSVEGYPHCVNATVEFEAMDVAYVGNDGEFMSEGFGNQAFELNECFQKLVEGVKTVGKAGAGFIDNLVGTDVVGMISGKG